jgi:hypothetical protein
VVVNNWSVILKAITLSKILIPILAVITLVPLTACTKSEADISLTLEEVIVKSKSIMGELKSCRMAQSVSTTSDGKVVEKTTNIEVMSPDRRHETSNDNGHIGESIAIGQTLYKRYSGTDAWQSVKLPEETVYPFNYLVNRVFDPDFPVTGIVKLADEKIDGVNCFHYKGNGDMEAGIEKQRAIIEQSLPDDLSPQEYEDIMKSLEESQEIMRKWKIDDEYWIGKDDYLLRQWNQVSDIVNAGENEMEERTIMVSTIRFYDFNIDIKIEPPLNIVDVYGG